MIEDVRLIIQKKLDKTLLKFGITSHHLRKVDTTYILNNQQKINENEYVVYRVISSKGIYGEGNSQIQKIYIDLNFYYKYDKNTSDYITARNHFNELRKIFLEDENFIIANDEKDIDDYDNPFRGINLEVCYIGK